MKYLFKNARVVAMNSKMEILDRCNVLVENDYIKMVGDTKPEDEVNVQIIDCTGKLLMPGFINGHTHVPMSVLRNYADDMELQTWLFNHIFPVEDRLTGEDVYYSSLLGIMEMLASGTTCFVDMYFFMDDIAKAVEISGIRAHLSRGMTGNDKGPDFSDNKSLNESIDFYKKWNGAADGRITGAFAPHAIYTCSPEYIKAIRDAAEKLGAPIHVHLDETFTEHENSLKDYNKTPTKHLYDLGLFDLKTIAAHCVWITEEDISLLKEKNVTIAHNPKSNLKLASGIAPIPEAISEGVNIILGTDGVASNNNLNMFEEIGLAALIHKGAKLDPTLISAKDALAMATVNGSKALGRNDLGKIAPGKKADLILIDLNKPHFTPLHNPVSALAYCAQGSDVCLTMVNGQILYENGEFKTIDEQKVQYYINKICQRIFI
ncbi:MAG: amidohydrolase [Clostridiaceae bacterium]|nr:amidohydrolase [Clostridiaceae bacterium]